MVQYTTIDLITNEIPKSTCHLFLTFIDSFKIENTFPYKSLLDRAILTETYTLNVYLDHLSDFSTVLYEEILSSPTNIIANLENILTIKYIIKEDASNYAELRNILEIKDQTDIPSICDANKKRFVIHFTSSTDFTPLRTITSSFNGKLIRVRGIVVGASVPIYKPHSLFLTCKQCMRSIISTFIPRTCGPTCGIDPFDVNPERCSVYDQQSLKIQETFDDIPMGELPRHTIVHLERNLVDSVVPGDRVKFTGIVQVQDSKFSSLCFIKVIGMEKENKNRNYFFSEKEKDFFKEISRHNIYKLLQSLFAPQIYGNSEIKKAILALLFGGSYREKHGSHLRADINVLLIGDPGCAKSQLLKYTNMVSSGVYTSGKGSSAAGLTACVVKKKHGGFALEGGALVLSDLGVCCIDEFDKMNVEDRVSIHEAMEQQTISISKAGINTVLKTRCSILAASNPVFGKYDEYKDLSENIDFGSTILSRFDCVFIVKDRDNVEKDTRLAMHILQINQNKQPKKSEAENLDTDKAKNMISDSGLFENNIDFLRKYISYSKFTVKPTLTPTASQKLIDFYVKARKLETLPITVRQLESMIRISEALAKMELKQDADEDHVNEAIRIFSASTLEAGKYGKKDSESVFSTSEKIRKLLPIGMAISFEKMMENFYDIDAGVFQLAIEYLVRNGKIILHEDGKRLIKIN